MAYRVRQGRNFVTPPTGLSYTGSYVHYLPEFCPQARSHHLPLLGFCTRWIISGEENYTPNPILEKALDVLFLIHADHELNASCTTVLQTGSSLVDPYSAVAYVHIAHESSVLPDHCFIAQDVLRYSE